MRFSPSIYDEAWNYISLNGGRVKTSELLEHLRKKYPNCKYLKRDRRAVWLICRALKKKGYEVTREEILTVGKKRRFLFWRK